MTCRRHAWQPLTDAPDACARCGRARNALASRRARNNRARGTCDELAVARIIGGEKVGPLGLPWDVAIPGYLRAQAKKLDRWPSIGALIALLDAIPPTPELRAVTLADTPGPGRRTRRLIVFDLDEWATWHGARKP